MRESNNVKKCTASSNFLSLVVTMLSILMILTSLSSSPVALSVSPVAFASHGGDYLNDRSVSDTAKTNYNNNQEGEGDWGLIDNLISQQQNPQADARNINADNKVIIVENCEDGEVIINDNDQIIQTNTQSFNQEAYNQVGEGEGEGEGDWGLIDNLISQQQNPQADARNINADNKVIIVENCEDGEVIINDNDQIIQTNTQSFNQEAYNQVGEGEGEGDDG
jgi:bifunctional DNA-binding transcriptional regulator/antitoxin component of YhaV-PrlF toxin-antitoxin module